MRYLCLALGLQREESVLSLVLACAVFQKSSPTSESRGVGTLRQLAPRRVAIGLPTTVEPLLRRWVHTAG